MPSRVTKRYKKAKPFVQGIRKAVFEGSTRYLRKVATLLAESVQDTILYQINIKPPLSDAWLERKRREGYDLRILVMTQEYVDNISVIETPTPRSRGGTFEVSVGFPNKPHSRAKVAFAQLMLWLEYGTRKMPARPHWRPVWERFKVRMPQHAERIRIEVLRDLLA